MAIDERKDPSDEDLLVRVTARDVDALSALYDRHRSIAYGLALRVTRSVPVAEDAVQEAFLNVWRDPSGFDPRRGSARSWLLAVVHHRAIDLIRRRRPSDPLPDPSAFTPDALVAPDVWPEVAGRLDAVTVREALTALSDVQREAIELAYWGGLSQSEIATRTGVPLGTVKGRLRLGLLALGRSLAAGAGPDDLRPSSGGSVRRDEHDQRESPSDPDGPWPRIEVSDIERGRIAAGTIGSALVAWGAAVRGTLLSLGLFEQALVL